MTKARPATACFPVGRLDADTTGQLLLTDDGDMAFRLTHPRYKVAKEYVALVTGNPSSSDVETLRKGVNLDDGVTAPPRSRCCASRWESATPGIAELRVVIREGRIARSAACCTRSATRSKR